MNNISKNQESIKAGVAGASGYAGQALVNILKRHPNVDKLTLFFSDTNQYLDAELNGNVNDVHIALIEQFDQACQELDVVFLATPPQTSISLSIIALKQGTHVIDLSGAFRLNAKEYKDWYHQQHYATQHLDQAIYGLVPFRSSTAPRLKPAQLIANPGCYASCALMCLLPLLQADLIDPGNIIIDAKSGVSGAGRTPNQDCMFVEINENFYPYKIGCHQHLPEITRYCQHYSGTKTNIIFNTQILPLSRGLAITLYAKSNAKLKDIETAYLQSYTGYPFVKFCCAENSIKAQQLCALKYVTHTPNTHIVFTQQSDWLLIFACIDNLLKGAASQAIENFNQLFSLPIETGLTTP